MTYLSLTHSDRLVAVRRKSLIKTDAPSFGIGVMTILFSVLTEAFSSKYHASLHKSKGRLHKLAIKSGTPQTPNPDPEGFVSTNYRSAITPTAALMSAHPEGDVHPDLGKTLIEHARNFNEHAQYFLHGREGDVPEQLRALLELGHDDESFSKLMHDVEQSGDGDMRGDYKRTLFLISYQRALLRAFRV